MQRQGRGEMVVRAVKALELGWCSVKKTREDILGFVRFRVRSSMALGMALALAMATATMAILLVVAQGVDDRVADLLRRQASSQDGVIALDDNSVRYVAASPDRPYALLVFFDALQLRERSDLKLDELRKEFGLMAQSYINNNAVGDGRSKVFFSVLEFQQSQPSFSMFGVNSLPHIRYLPPGSCLVNASEVMEMGDMSRSAEGMSSFLESRIKHKVGHIQRPPLLSKTKILLIAAAVALLAPVILRRLATQDGTTPFHNPKLWCTAALAVYFFSVSGAMHNIIRKMPMFMADRKNPSKLLFFYQGSGMQLGAEGFIVASLYMLVGLAIAFITHMLLLFKSKLMHRLFMLLALALCYWAVTKVVLLDHWKTGYEVHAYVPKRWLS